VVAPETALRAQTQGIDVDRTLGPVAPRRVRTKISELKPTMSESKPKTGWTLITIVVVIFLLSCLAVFLLVESSWWARLMCYYELFTDRVWVREMVKSAGWASTLVFVGLQIGQVIFAPIPGEVTGFLGGYMFGALNGFLLSTVGLTAGSMLAFGIGHFLGERVVRKLVRCESFEKYNQLVQYKGVLVIFIFFLVPGFPKDYLCMFLGLTTLPGRVFFVVSTVGRLPGTLALSLQGASIFEKDYMFFAIVTALTLLFALGAWLLRDPLYRWMARLKKKSSCDLAS
jgi:uncharacterized membrane protein YdjX (TVP38/TMEM64 family)